jgi:hypothetical protein
VVHQIADRLTVAASIQDLNSKFTWDTSPLYGQSGATTTYSIPTIIRFGGAYALGDSSGLITADLEQSSAKTTTLRLGAEFALVDGLTLRGGLSGLDFANRYAYEVRPSLGLTVREPIGRIVPIIHFALVFEPLGLGMTQILSVGFSF